MRLTVARQYTIGPVPTHPYPTVAFDFILCSEGVWDLMDPPPYVVLDDGTRVAMSPALSHPSHTAIKTVTVSSETVVTWVWDARLDGFNPLDETTLGRWHYVWAWYNMACSRVEIPPPPPEVPPDPPPPDIPSDPPSTPGVPSDPGSPPVEPVDIDTPVFIPTTPPTIDPGGGGLVEEPPTTFEGDIVVPGMPSEVPPVTPTDTVSPVDVVPVAPVAPGPVIPVSPPTLTSDGIPMDVVAPTNTPDVFVVPTDTYAPTEPPTLDRSPVSNVNPEGVEDIEPGGEMGIDLFNQPNIQDGNFNLTPIPYNTYNAPVTTVDYSGADDQIDGMTIGVLHVFLAPSEIVPLGEPALISVVVQNGDGSPLTGGGIIIEYEDEFGTKTTLGVTEMDVEFPANSNSGKSVIWETSFFSPGGGTIRGILVNSSRVCIGVVERTIWLEGERTNNTDYREEPSMPPMAIQEAMTDLNFQVNASFFESGKSPTYYLQATGESAEFALMLHAYTLDMNVQAQLEFGTFDGSGIPQAPTVTSTDPLRTVNGVDVSPASHQVYLKATGLTVANWYYIRAVQTTGVWSATMNFTLWGQGAIDRNKEVFTAEEGSRVVGVQYGEVLSPTGNLTIFQSDSNGHLSGNMYLPYDQTKLMLVNERTSEAVVVDSTYETDVQADSLTGLMGAVPGDRIAVFRTGQSTMPELVNRFEVSNA